MADFTGTDDNESRSGSTGVDSLAGMGGNDTLDGGAGDDTLDGGDGADSVYGGANDDVLIQTGATGGPGLIDGGDGTDTLRAVGVALGQNNVNGVPVDFAGVAGTGVNSIERLDLASVAGRVLTFQIDITQLAAGKIDPASVVVGGAGIDLLRVVTPFGATGGFFALPNLTLSNWTTTLDLTTSDLVVLAVSDTNSGHNYTLEAAEIHAGIQSLQGNNGADMLVGGEDQEVLGGGSGDDTLDGDWGDDTLTGGSGADVFAVEIGQNVITDFVHLTDKFDTSQYGFDGFASLSPFLSASGGDTVLSLFVNGALQTTTFKGVAFGTLTADDFIVAGANPINHTGEDAGTDNSDFLPGGSGGDSVDGAGGADTLVGYAGGDSLAGNTGDDTLNGGLNNDTLVGGSGNDTLDGGDGADSVYGGLDDDVLIQTGATGGPGLVDGGGGTDTLRGVGVALGQNNVNGVPIDFAGVAGTGVSSIERLELASQAGRVLVFQIDASQIAAGKIDPASVLVGGAGIDVLRVVTPFGATGGAFSLPNFTLSNWTTTADLTTSDVVNLSVNDTDSSHSYTLFAAETHGGIQSLVGNNGDDELVGGDGQESLGGGSGNDTIESGWGDDTSTGAGGADVFVLGGGQDVITDFVHLTDKFDTSDYGFDSFASLSPFLSASGGDTVLSIVYNGVTNTTTFKGVAFGTLTADDFIVAGGNPVNNTGDDAGTPNADFGPGSSGGDSIDGVGGNDTIVGYAGNDSLVGNTGDDTLNGGLNNDTLDGGSGNDTLDGGDGSDSVFGGADDDVLIQVGGTGAATVDGGQGTDTLRGVGTATGLNNPNGVPIDSAGVAGTTVSSIERIELASTTGRVLVFQIDRTQIAAGKIDPATVVVGGAGIDVLRVVTPFGATGGSFDLPALNLSSWTTTSDPATSDLVALAVSDTDSGHSYTLFAAETHGGIQSLQGNNGADSLVGGDSQEVLAGGAGADTLASGWGEDTMTGGAGADVFQVDGGGHKVITDFNLAEDRFDVTGIGVPDLAALSPYLSQSGADVVFALTYNGALQTYTLKNVTLGSLTAANFIFDSDTTGHADTGTANADVMNGGPGSDTEMGAGGDDTVVGWGGNDQLFGDQGADSVLGGTGSDTLTGGEGNDTLSGGEGSDSYFGGAGSDRVVIAAPAGQTATVSLGADADTLVLDPTMAVGATVTVTDFATGAAGDALSITGFLSARTNWTAGTDPFVSGHLRLVQDGADARLELDVDGGANSFVPLVTFQTGSVLDLTAFNLGGWAPQAVSGGGGGDTISYTPEEFVQAGETPPAIDGGGGVDVLTIVTPPPEQVVGPATITPSADGLSLLMDLNGDGITDLVVGAVEDIVLNGEQVVISGDLANTGLAPNTIHYEGTSRDNLLDASGLTSLESIRAFGDDGNDTLIGGNDDDILRGGDGADSLVGRGGPDSLNGGSGADVLRGAAGSDTLDGGTGVDRFEGAAADLNGDLIVNYDSGEKIFLLQDLASVAKVQLDASGADALLKIDADNNGSFETTLTLQGLTGGGVLVSSEGGGTNNVIRVIASTVSISPATVTHVEGNSGLTAYEFTLTRSGDTSQAVTVDWAATGIGGAPANATDFQNGALPSGQVSFGIGDTSKTVTVNVAGDTVFEASEGFKVTLSNPVGGAGIGTAVANGVITNDDTAPTLAISATDAVKPEGDSGLTAFTFTVARTGDLSVATTADWAVTGSGPTPASASDFQNATLPSGQVNFGINENSKTVTVYVAGDTLAEPNEGFTVTLSNQTAGAVLGVASATGSITSDDNASSLSIAATATGKLEGNSGATAHLFTITRTGDLSVPANVNWAVTGSGANAASAADFTGNALPNGVVNFDINESSKTFVVNVAGDATVEQTEGFTVTLSGATGGALIGVSTAQGGIVNDDGPNAFSGSGNDTFNGSDGADTIPSGSGADSVNGGLGDDSLAGGSGADTLTGGDGADTLTGEALEDLISGGANNDSLNGGSNADTISGDEGNDTIVGDSGEDSLGGGGGSDSIIGDSGADTLAGGAGADTLNGGSNADLFLFGTGGGADQVNGFALGADHLRLLDGITVSNWANAGGSATLNLSDGGAVTLAGVTLTGTSFGDLFG